MYSVVVGRGVFMNSRLDNLCDMFEIEDDSYTNVEADTYPNRRFLIEAEILGTETELSQCRKDFLRLKKSEASELALFELQEYLKELEDELEELNKQLGSL